MAEKIDGTGNAEINNIRFAQQISHPSSPSSGHDVLYIISGSAHGGLYVKDSDGKQIGPFITGTAGGSPAFVGARVYHAAANQTVATSPGTALVFDTENFDTDGFHSTDNNPSRLTVPAGKAGKYLIGGGFYADTECDAQIKVNATTVLALARAAAPSSSIIGHTIQTIYQLAEGDYVELIAIAASGTKVVYKDSVFSPHFWLQYLGA